MKIFLIILLIICIGFTHILSAIKSGMFYAVSSKNKPKLLEKFINNMHYVQTPFWYACFGSLFLSIFLIYYDDYFILFLILKSYLITQGTSTVCGPFYQGFINVGAGKKFIDNEERREFEFAVPILNKSVWIPKFWHGKYRIILIPIGLIMIILGLTF